MTQVSDNFLRPDGALGPNWTIPSNPFGLSIQLINHAFASSSGAINGFPTAFGIWAGGQPFGNDQLVSAQISAIAPEQSVVAITAAVQSGGNTTYTYTLTSGAALQNPQEMIVSGMGHAGNNGNFVITGLGAGTFTVVNASGATAIENGTGTSPTDSLLGIGTRCTPDALNGYFVYIGNNSAYVAFDDGTVPDNRLYVRELWDNVGGVFSYLSSIGPTNNYNPVPDSPGDIFTMGILADKLCFFKNNVILRSVTNSSLVSGLPAIDASSATGAGHATPIGANLGVSGTQWTNFTAQDLPLTPPGWARAAYDNMNSGGAFNPANWSTIATFNNVCQNPGDGTGTGQPGLTSSAVWTGRSWANNHSSTIVIYSATGNTSVNVLVRSLTAAFTCYLAQFVFTNGLGPGTFALAKFIAGSSSPLQSGGGSGIPGSVGFCDVLRVDCVGTSINFYHNGTLVVSGTDNTLASGSPAILFNADTVDILFWEGDEIAASQAATPVAAPAAGKYPSQQTVTLTCSTPGAYIYYTTDGSTPTTSSTLYTGPFTIRSSQTVKAIAVAGGFLTSNVLSASYVIGSSDEGSNFDLMF